MCHAIHSEAGHGHANEDAVVVEAHPKDPHALLCVLADGQGGQRGGAAAARTAVSTCHQLASAFSVERLLDRATWNTIFRGTDGVVFDDRDAGFTTLIGICVAVGKVCGASCGDSAALLVDDARYTVLTAGQRKDPPVGSSAAVPTSFTADFRGSALIMMSDGVWKGLGHDAIAELCRSSPEQELIPSLRRLKAGQTGGKLPDDFSIVVVRSAVIARGGRPEG